ncbi:hypothetical protein FRC11_002064, partial [Ceratobasidium sp. 423]
MLKSVQGVFHIGLDMYQSPNGIDFLGLVIFYPAVKDNLLQIERFVLECLSFSGKHTGVALANTVYKILCKFDIQDRVWGVICDNASNNADMMNCFTKFNMQCLTGPKACIQVLFLQKRSELEKADKTWRLQEPDELDIPSGSDGEEEEPVEDEDKGGSIFEDDFDPNKEDETGEDDGTAPSCSLDPDDIYNEDLLDIIIPDLIVGSLDGKELNSARKALHKITWLACKLRFSPHFKHGFQELCVFTKALGPHNVQRDVITRWNSTKTMIEDVLRLQVVILKYQEDPEYPADKHLSKNDFKAMKVLLELLKPLSTLTEILSKSKVPMLADVLVHYDGLNQLYCNMANDKSLPLWGRQGANRARLKLDKHYSTTDTSNMYRLAT